MAQWIKVAHTDEIPEGSIKICEHYPDIILVHYQQQFYALENACSHNGAPLEEGTLENGELVCPWHGARFCLQSGTATLPPAYEPITTYPVRVEGSDIELLLD